MFFWEKKIKMNSFSTDCNFSWKIKTTERTTGGNQLFLFSEELWLKNSKGRVRRNSWSSWTLPNSPIPPGKTRGGERSNWNVPDETFKANRGTLCWAGPSCWLLSPEQNPSLSHEETSPPINCPHPRTRIHLPASSTWGSPPQKHNLPLPTPSPRLNTAGGTEQHSTDKAAGEEKNLLENPPLSPLPSPQWP